VILGLAILVTMGLRKARAGRVLIGVRDNERAAASAAVPTTSVRLAGFAVAGVIAGIAGALDVYLLQALNPGSFAPVDSMTVFGYSVIGGLGSVTGVLLGVLIFKYLESITAFGTYHLAISGAALLWVLQVLPGGFGQVVYDIRDRLLRVVADRRGILVPSLVADKRAAGTGGQPDDLLSAIAAGEAGMSNGNGKARSVDAEATVPLEVKS
ncbi:MAG TPA: branched-chain amino acid ABC transporter permease, partial [Acidimicrobiales bacterium]|nr:branched-chain amino acid ABC transporter permease [Acidimicrobiales bacterium]